MGKNNKLKISENFKDAKQKKGKKNIKMKKTVKKVAKLPNKEVESDNVIEMKPVRFSDELVQTQNSKWVNKQRVMMIASRGITFRDRHLLNNLKTLMPHSKSEPKMETKKPNIVLNEICGTRNCNKCIFFENRRRKDLYMWMTNAPNGPSAKFLVENVHTMEEMRMTGNGLKASRPFLSFDPQFDSESHLGLLKELFVQIFGIPNGHPKSQPFYDHVYTFTFLDHRIWFRNYQIVDETGSLAEIGPRFTMNLIKIFEGSFSGRLLYTNPHYVAPNKHRIMIKKMAAAKYNDRKETKKSKALTKPKSDDVYADMDKYDDVFNTV